MKKVLMMAVVLVAFAAPAGAATAKTSKADKQEAKRECRAERGTTDATREAFKIKWGGFGHCLHQTAREAKAERKAARREAKKACKGEHPFGKCVSQKAKAKEKAQDDEDAAETEDFKNAAQECDSERSADSKAFADKYGTNHNKKNAFGKCVSQKSHADSGDEDDGS
jgi:hypothetical protein